MLVQPYSARLPIGIGRGLRCDPEAPLSRRGRKRQRDWQRELMLSGKRFITTSNIAYAAYTTMTVTNLQSLANDATDPFASWQSARVDNQTSVKADNYEIVVNLSTAATAPANDSAAYVYVVPWVTTDGGTTWITGGNFGTVTLPTGTEGTANISDPNSMKGPVTIPYKITSQRLETYFTISQMCGIVPDGWSLAIRNCTGAALSTSCVVAFRAISETFT